MTFVKRGEVGESTELTGFKDIRSFRTHYWHYNVWNSTVVIIHSFIIPVNVARGLKSSGKHCKCIPQINTCFTVSSHRLSAFELLLMYFWIHSNIWQQCIHCMYLAYVDMWSGASPGFERVSFSPKSRISTVNFKYFCPNGVVAPLPILGSPMLGDSWFHCGTCDPSTSSAIISYCQLGNWFYWDLHLIRKRCSILRSSRCISFAIHATFINTPCFTMIQMP
jgi:hypothetical protein